ncbi:MAG: hypothetical protein IPO93_17180 [Actinobacteria bacterium]|nr:hypothetical protein [Actinomycetota bacterium]
MTAVPPQPERTPRDAIHDARDDSLDPDTTPEVPARSRYKGTLAELEAEAHVPLDDQTEEQATPPARGSSSAWDEERRQLRLAGGPM